MNHYLYSELFIGMEESFCVSIEEKVLELFRMITQDNNPLHVNKNYAKKNNFPDRIVYGMLTSSFLSTLAGVYLPGERSLIQGVDIKFINPVFVGDELRVKGKITELNDSVQQIVMKVDIWNQNETKVVRGKMKIGVL